MFVTFVDPDRIQFVVLDILVIAVTFVGNVTSPLESCGEVSGGGDVLGPVIGEVALLVVDTRTSVEL